MFKNKNLLNLINPVLVVILLLTAYTVDSQTRIISPYSQYGLGELQNNTLSRNLAVSGIGYGYRSNRAVNYLNPASYSAVDSTSFVFEIVGFSHFYHQETTTQDQFSNYSSLGNISMNFPVTGKIGVALGVKPFSHVGHKVTTSETIQNGSVIEHMYEGSGGINDVFLGASYEVFNGLSLGANASYLFGSTEYLTTATPLNVSGFKKTYKSETDYVGGLLLNYGIQYKKDISDDRNFILGFTYSHDTNIGLTREMTIEEEIPGTTNREIVRQGEEQKGNLTIPKNVGLGSWIKYNNNWSAGFDINWQNWDNFKRFDQKIDNLQDRYNMALGFKYSPTVTTYTGAFANADYMFGVRYGQSHLNINDYSYDEMGISAGLSLPIRQTSNGVNIGFEYSQRGTTDGNRIKEDFYKINIGFNIYERWFIKRRFF